MRSFFVTFFSGLLSNDRVTSKGLWALPLTFFLTMVPIAAIVAVNERTGTQPYVGMTLREFEYMCPVAPGKSDPEPRRGDLYFGRSRPYYKDVINKCWGEFTFRSDSDRLEHIYRR